MTILGAVQMFLFASVALFAASGLLLSALVPLALRWTAAWAPASRHRALALLAATPFVLTATALLAMVLPSLLGLVWPELDHCHGHSGHSHLCFLHPSDHAGGLLGWTVIGAAASCLFARSCQGARALVRAARVIERLEATARRDGERALWVVPTDQPVCLSVGLFRPRFLISRGLLATTGDTELGVIAAHEHAHARRKDSLVRAAAHALTVTTLPAARRLLLAALELAAESACDEAAARESGDRLCVAETLLAIERRFASFAVPHGNPLIAGFGASSLPLRVEAMLAPARDASALPVLVCALLGAVCAVLGSFEHVHHAVESLFTPFSC